MGKGIGRHLASPYLKVKGGDGHERGAKVVFFNFLAVFYHEGLGGVKDYLQIEKPHRRGLGEKATRSKTKGLQKGEI